MTPAVRLLLMRPTLAQQARRLFENAAGEMFDPAAAFARGEIWQDTARTTPAGINDVVGSIRGELGRFYAEQGTTANKPFLRGTPTGAELLGGAGSFASATGWQLTAGTTISGGTLNFNAAGAGEVPNRPVTAAPGRIYRISYTIVTMGGGDIRARLFTDSVTIDGGVRTAAGTYVDYITAGAGTNPRIGLRSAAATTAQVDNLEIYDVTAGQVVAPYFLQGDGTDLLATSTTMDFTASDEATMVASFYSGDNVEAQGIGNLGYSNNGSLGIFAPSSGGSTNCAYISKGTSIVSASSNIAKPKVFVVSGRSKISAPIATLRVDGVQTASSSASQGTGNYGNHTLYLMSGVAAGSPLRGNLNFLAVINRQLSDADTAILERLAARAAGVTL